METTGKEKRDMSMNNVHGSGSGPEGVPADPLKATQNFSGNTPLVLDTCLEERLLLLLVILDCLLQSHICDLSL